MKRGTLVLLILAIVIFGVFYAVDYFNDAANKKQEDLYKTVLKRGYIIVGVKTDTKPFGFIDGSGSVVGFDVDIAHEIAKELFHDPQKVKFVPVSDNNRLYLLNLNKLDMVIATLTISQTRMAAVNFSKPYYLTGQTLLVRTGSPVRSMADLSDKKVGVIFGSTAEQTMKFLLPTAKVLGYKSYDEAYQALKRGDILAITSDDAILRRFALADSGVQITPRKYSKDFYGIAFRKTDESKVLLETVNNVISDMDKQGKLNTLRDKWGLK